MSVSKRNPGDFPGSINPKLRLHIAEIIRNQGVVEECALVAALNICVYLENVGLELAKNGWFDDDPKVEDALRKTYEVSNCCRNR